MKNESMPKGPGRAMRGGAKAKDFKKSICLLYTSDAADE